MKNCITLLALSLFVVPVSSCTDLAAQLRQHTYPPTFHYPTDQQLRSTMWQLAYHSRVLRQLMTSPDKLPLLRHSCEPFPASGKGIVY